MNDIPAEIRAKIQEAKEQQLKELDLSYDYRSNYQLTEIPTEVFELEQLESLDLKENNIKQIPQEILRLQNLKSLNLIGNRLTEISEAIGNLPSLIFLGLNWNRSEPLPSWISQIEQLGLSLKLDFSLRFKLTSLPESITKLTNLTQLDLRENQLTSLPKSITKLTNFTKLSLSENPLKTPPIEIAYKGIKAIKKYFRQLEEEGKDYIYEAKLLIVGEGGAGKTTLAKKIESPDYQLNPDEESTEGIDIIQWSFPHKEQTFRVNIWDFGGQEIYHATHQFFLTKRSLYALVADTRKEDTDFYYWLNVVELLSDNSPLLIVKNEKGDRRIEIDENSLRGRFENFKESFGINLAKITGDRVKGDQTENDRFQKILESCQHLFKQLPHIGQALPKTWKQVREALEKDERNYISLQEYLDICETNGFTRHEDKLQLSDYLHDLGVCLHFQDNPLLKKTVIIKPEWGTAAVYKVLDNDAVIRNLGKFTKSDLQNIWSEEQYSYMQDELLELMTKFKLCYLIPNTQDTYIAPQLLTKIKPDYSWDKNNNLILRYTYEFMPKGIITQFIVVMHQDIDKQQNVWRSGVVLHKHDTKAEVIEYYDQKRINIRVSGKNKKKLITIVSYELDKIHKYYEDRLKVDKLIPCNCSECEGQQEPYFYTFDVLENAKQKREIKIQCQKSFKMVNVLGLIDDIIKKRAPNSTPKMSESLSRNKIFISYSHNDSDWLKRLQVYLKPLERKGLVDRWDDTRIKAGMKWRQEIQKALDSAQIAILLVSANFLASNFIDEVELPQLLEAAESEGALILSVILNPCQVIFSLSDLKQFQTVNPPSKPLSGMDDHGQDEVFNKLVERIVEVVKELP